MDNGRGLPNRLAVALSGALGAGILNTIVSLTTCSRRR
jgi:hypothetical protein